jgi:hypothetical protein
MLTLTGLLAGSALLSAPRAPRSVQRVCVTAVQTGAEAAEADDATRCLNKLLELRGRCSLAEAGDTLRSEGVGLPDGQTLSAFVDSRAEFTLSGRPSNRLISLATQTTAAALVSFVAQVLQELGRPVSTAELKLRISERGRFVPGLSALLRAHSDTFVVADGMVGLRSAGDEAALSALASGGEATHAMVRLQRMDLGAELADGSLPPADSVREVLLVDMDNKAFLLEACAAYAARDGVASCSTLVVGFCATTHNPRVSPSAADQISALSHAGWLRVITPARDTKNAADFVCSFWVGWLHSALPPAARFAILSTDIHLERTLVDLLRGTGRQVVSNPAALRPGVAPPSHLHSS